MLGILSRQFQKGMAKVSEITASAYNLLRSQINFMDIKKQDILIAGPGIRIENGIISLDMTVLSASQYIALSDEVKASNTVHIILPDNLFGPDGLETAADQDNNGEGET